MSQFSMEATPDCILCARTDQPPALFETNCLYVMPDKYPLCLGHTLIVSKDHLACYGDAPAELQRELDETAANTRRFLADSYGKPVLLWENGVSGQTVYHAHLHLMPLPIEALPDELEAHADVTPVEGWDAIGARYARAGHYRYLELEGKRRLLEGHSSALGSVVRMLAQATGLRYGRAGWVKTTTPDDVAEVGRRFEAWRIDDSFAPHWRARPA